MDAWNAATSTPDDAEAQGAGVCELKEHVKQATTFESYQRIYHQALHRRQGGGISAPLDTAYQTSPHDGGSSPISVIQRKHLCVVEDKRCV